MVETIGYIVPGNPCTVSEREPCNEFRYYVVKNTRDNLIIEYREKSDEGTHRQPFENCEIKMEGEVFELLANQASIVMDSLGP